MAPQTINSPLSMFARAACALLLAGSGPVLAQSGSGPQVTIKNGTVEGKHVASLNQDLFLGIPFAQPPVGDLRFQNPQSINTSWPEIKNATEYGPSCVGYGVSLLLLRLLIDLMTWHGTDFISRTVRHGHSLSLRTA